MGRTTARDTDGTCWVSVRYPSFGAVLADIREDLIRVAAETELPYGTAPYLKDYRRLGKFRPHAVSYVGTETRQKGGGNWTKAVKSLGLKAADDKDVPELTAATIELQFELIRKLYRLPLYTVPGYRIFDRHSDVHHSRILVFTGTNSWPTAVRRIGWKTRDKRGPIPGTPAAQPKVLKQMECWRCGVEFGAIRANQRYCSTDCRKIVRAERARGRRRNLNA